MRTAVALALLGLLFVVPARINGQARPSTPLRPGAGPKLVVIIVIDQMRADFVDRFEPEWTSGLKRLVTRGAWFRNAAYPYLTTVTCAGHATISTGNFPHVHGIVQNAWWDRRLGAQRTCTEDPSATAIGYNRPVKEGHSAWQLQRPTLTDVLRSQRGARVATLSLKARSAIMLAGHGADAVTWLDESLDGWMTSSVFSEGPVPAVSRFVEANPIASDFRKTWERLLPADRYAEADDAPGEAPPRGWTRSFPHVLNGTSTTPDAAFATQWEMSPFANAYLGRFAAALVDTLPLGSRDGNVDVLAVSFSTPDIAGHAFGPRSQEVHDLYLRLDRTIGELLDHLDSKVGRGRWVAALSADHGSTPIPEQLVAQGKDGGRLDSKVIAAVIEDRLRAALGEGRHVAMSYYNDIYFAPGVYDKMRANPELMKSVVQALLNLPGIARVFRSDELRDPKVAADRLQRAAALTYFPGRSGDLMIAAKPGWEFTATGASHGSTSDDDRRVPVLFYGDGVKPGRYQDEATPADLAPTLAAILGVKMPDTEGHVLGAALEHP